MLLRRLITIPAAFVAWLCFSAALPLVVPAALIDAIGRRTSLARALLFFWIWTAAEAGGLVACGLLLLVAGPWNGTSEARYQALNRALQRSWAALLLGSMTRLYALEVEVEDGDAPGPGPILLLVRHANTADTLLPMILVALPHRLALRYVMKEELLWDPCLDVVGHRIPNVFVRRGSEDPAAEAARIGALARGMTSSDGVAFFPEGTRFSPGRRARRLAELAERGDARALAAAEALERTLLPHTRGTFALLDAAPHADVVLCGHMGFEVARDARSLFDRALVGRTIRVRFWRHPAASIPTDPDARTAWLYARWAELDAWVRAVDPVSAPKSS